MPMLAWFFWDPSRELLRLPVLGHPIAWYGVIFALGFFVGYLVLIHLLQKTFPELGREGAKAFVERLSLYVIIGTVVGARLGHVFFYSAPSEYLSDPLSILKTWEGGLASHGGVVGVIAAMALFYFRVRKLYPFLTFIGLVDMMTIPAAFAAGAIRLGNFCNQEILGKISYVPWAIIFGHAADGSPPMPRHPVQLYEAGLYFALFIALLGLYRRLRVSEGGLAGWFFLITFTGRFLIEFCKEEQSALLDGGGWINMGQWLSLPMIGIGLFFLLRKQRERAIPIDGNQGDSLF